MPGKIIGDKRRFDDIIKRSVRKNLHKFISRGEFILPDKSGKGKISIPIPRIDIPRFKFEDREYRGIGQGEGEEGDVLWDDGQESGGRAGDQPGDPALEEIELSVEDFFQILGEELKLPRIEPKGKKVKNVKYSYRGIRRVGPESLKQFKRTYKEALKRQIASGDYNYKRPLIVPIKDDRRYRSLKSKDSSETSAAIFHIIDVSGSITDEQRDIVRRITFCTDGWIARYYKGVEQRYIIHHAEAEEVDRETFFRIGEGGGTIISTALKLCLEIIKKDYPIDEWNIYVFYFSDGDNWSNENNELCMKLLGGEMLPQTNLACFGHLLSNYGGGDFFKSLKMTFKNEEKVIIAKIRGRDDILKTVKKFLGKGK